MARKRKEMFIGIYRSDQWKCCSWCLENNIKVSLVPKRYNQEDYQVEVNLFGDITKSDIRYSLEDAQMKYWELYCFLHDKYNQDSPHD